MAKDPALEREWRERVKRHEESGLTIQAFCEQDGIPAPRFSWWRRELKRRDARVTKSPKKNPATKRTVRSKPTDRAFLPVDVAAVTKPTPSIEIVLDDPPRIAVTAGFDPQLLVEVLQVLENRSC